MADAKDGVRFIGEVQDHLVQVRHKDAPGHWTFSCCRKGLTALLGIPLRPCDKIEFTLTASNVEKRRD